MTFPYPDDAEESRNLIDLRMDTVIEAAEDFVKDTPNLRLQFSVNSRDTRDFDTACRFNHHAKKLSKAVGGLYSFEPLERSIIIHAAVCQAKDLGGKISTRRVNGKTQVTVTRA